MSIQDDMYDVEYSMGRKRNASKSEAKAFKRIVAKFNEMEVELEMLQAMRSGLKAAMSIANRKT